MSWQNSKIFSVLLAASAGCQDVPEEGKIEFVESSYASCGIRGKPFYSDDKYLCVLDAQADCKKLCECEVATNAIQECIEMHQDHESETG